MSQLEARSVGAPRVTVVTPVHNKSLYLRQALESIVAQTFPDWEAVVVDDASDDGSDRIAAEFAERYPGKIRAVRVDHNVGPSEARNRAIHDSGGELITLLDADDYWRADYLERQVAAFDSAAADGKRPGIMACNALVETPDGIIGRFDEVFWWSDEIDYDRMLERSYIMVSAMFPRAAIAEVGAFSPECWGSEDYDLWLRIIEAGYDVVTTRDTLAVYRHHPGGLSKNRLVMADAAIAAYGRALSRGAMTPHQRRRARVQRRHYRALRERALVEEAVRARAPMKAALASVRAVPWGLVAFLQSPSRWREWLGGLAERREPRIAGSGSSTRRR